MYRRSLFLATGGSPSRWRKKVPSTSIWRTTIMDDGIFAAVTPGEILQEEFLIGYSLSRSQLARAIGVSPNRIAGIVNNRRGIAADTALRLSLFFGNSPEFWLNLQSGYDLKMARAPSFRRRKRKVSSAPQPADGAGRASGGMAGADCAVPGGTPPQAASAQDRHPASGGAGAIFGLRTAQRGAASAGRQCPAFPQSSAQFAEPLARRRRRSGAD